MSASSDFGSTAILTDLSAPPTARGRSPHLVDTTTFGIARPALRSVRTLVALAHTIHNEVSTPLVALEAAGAAARPCAWLRR